MNEYAIDRDFYNIFEGFEIDEKKVRNFLITFHELLSQKDEISENKIREQKSILKAELKDELIKELATKADIEILGKDTKTDIEVLRKDTKANFEVLKRDIKVLDNKINEVEKRLNLKFEQVERRFESVDKRFEQIDKRFEKLENKLDKFLYIVVGSMFSVIGGAIFLLVRFGNFN